MQSIDLGWFHGPLALQAFSRKHENHQLHIGKMWIASLSETLVLPLKSLCCFKSLVCLKTSEKDCAFLCIVG